jgi:hypothetical protein
MKGKATSFDIAYHAGVSQSTVSRALAGSPLVSGETRRKILEVARQLNYTVDKNASNLRRQHSVTLALLLFEDPTSDDSLINPFFLSMLGSITRACAAAGLRPAGVVPAVVRRLACRLLRQPQGRWPDPARLRRLPGRYAQAAKAGRPAHLHFVRWGAVVEGQPGISVGCDNVPGRARHHRAPAGSRTPAHRFPRHASPHRPGVLRPLPRLLRCAARGGHRA